MEFIICICIMLLKQRRFLKESSTIDLQFKKQNTPVLRHEENSHSEIQCVKLDRLPSPANISFHMNSYLNRLLQSKDQLVHTVFVTTIFR